MKSKNSAATKERTMIYKEKRIDSEGIVAYGFLVDEDERTGNVQNRFIQLFHSATDARSALSCSTADIQVLVCDVTSEVSPLNLVAALHKDNPLRDIYLEKDEPQSLFISRVEAAGGRGVVSKQETAQLLGMRFEKQEGPRDTDDELPLCANDLAWLEEVLDLDELDELSQHAGPAVMERPLVQPGITEFDHPELGQTRYRESQEEGKGIVASFISGRGGVGKSSLTVLTACDLWRAGSRVVMLDLDLQFGDLSTLVGNEPESRIQRLGIEQVCKGSIKIPDTDASLVLLEAPQNPEVAEELIPHIPSLLSALRQVADIVLINTSCLWNEMAAVLASHADKLVVCMDQRATSISAARQVVDLCIRLHIPSTHMEYLLNRCARTAPITDIDASLAMGGVKIITIADGGADVDELLSLGCPLELLSSRSPLRQSIEELGGALLAKPGDETGLKGARIS